MLYEDCLAFVLENCDEQQIQFLTGCTSKQELASFHSDLLDLIRRHVNSRHSMQVGLGGHS